MKLWRMLKSVAGTLLGLAFALLLIRLIVLNNMETLPTVEEVIESTGNMGWLIGIFYGMMQYTWVLVVINVLLLGAYIFCAAMQCKEEDITPIRMIITMVIGAVAMLAVVHLVFSIYNPFK